MARKEHFVPKHYLEGFVDPNSKGFKDPYLWAVDLKELSLKNKAPKNVAKLAGLYDFDNGQSFEDHLTKIENQVERIFRRFRLNIFQISEEDRFHLAIYIGLQIVRTPLYHNITKAVEYKLAKELVKKILGGNGDGIHLEPSENFDDYALSLSLKIGIDFWSPLLFSGKWLFAISPLDVKFITSDNPVALFGQSVKPVIDKNLQVWFPISLDCGLLIDYKDGPSEVVDIIPSEVAEGLNKGILRIAQNYVFCSSQDIGNAILKSKQP